MLVRALSNLILYYLLKKTHTFLNSDWGQITFSPQTQISNPIKDIFKGHLLLAEVSLLSLSFLPIGICQEQFEMF